MKDFVKLLDGNTSLKTVYIGDTHVEINDEENNDLSELVNVLSSKKENNTDISLHLLHLFSFKTPFVFRLNNIK